MESSYSLFATRVLPLFPERTDFKLERPGAARLLIQLPVGGRNRRRRHQQVRVIERFLAPELFPALAHPRGVDAGIDDQMRDVNVLRSEVARHRLRHRTQSEFRAREGGITASPAQAVERAGQET